MTRGAPGTSCGGGASLFSWVCHSVTGVERSRQEAVAGLQLLNLFKHHRSKRDVTQTLLCCKYIFINKMAQGEPKVQNIKYSRKCQRDSSQENKKQRQMAGVTTDWLKRIKKERNSTNELLTSDYLMKPG
uniref:Uncharacterized protein n=1 Tax=Oncorhynchus kisutch TaxID=8019 RepID=A0A8C7LW02_ONCKI